MARLTALSPRLGGTARGLGFGVPAPKPEPVWKAWYKTAEWRALRKRVFVRDSYTCRRCGRICASAYPADDSPVADHVEPHRGNRQLFFDESNVQTLCKSPCHDKVKQAEEQTSRHCTGVWD